MISHFEGYVVRKRKRFMQFLLINDHNLQYVD